MSDSAQNKIPYVPQDTLDPAAGLNDAIRVIDALLNTRVENMTTNAPPGSPADGVCYIVGGAPTGAWAGHANALATYVADGAFWTFYAAGDTAWLVINKADGNLYRWDTTAVAWVQAAGIGDAPNDGDLYARRGLTWEAIPDITQALINPMTHKGALIVGGAVDSHDPAGHATELVAGAEGSKLAIKNGTPAYMADTLVLPLCSGVFSTQNDATNKRVVGGIAFDPTDDKWALGSAASVKLRALLATTAVGNVTTLDLYQTSGTGSPVVIATTPTSADIVASLVEVDVTAAFLANAGVFVARIWLNTNNAVDEASCLGAWLEITR